MFKSVINSGCIIHNIVSVKDKVESDIQKKHTV